MPKSRMMLSSVIAPRRRVVTVWPEGAAGPAILSPVMRGLPPGRASALALLPVRDANGELFAAIEPHRQAPADLCAGIFAADPFVGLTDAFRRLSRAGIAHIANWPSVGLYDERFRQELSAKGVGYEREIEFVAHASQAGFIPTATAFDLSQVLRMLEAGAASVILHPPLARGAVTGLADAIPWAMSIAGSFGGGAEILLYCEGDNCDAQSIPPSIAGLVVFDG